MRLAEFILGNMEALLVEWEAFARTLLPAAADMGSLALRNDAALILTAVARDIGTAQTREQQSEKSKGRAPTATNVPETAAQTHAVLRAHNGFDINQLVAEYRALRASVLRLWVDANPNASVDVDEMIRFNEAIDQAIAESIAHFHTMVEQSRNLLLGMLGHDMRSPLNTIVTTASFLQALNAGEEVSTAAKRMIRSGAAMQALLDDLVDFNRTRLGLGIKVRPAPIDLADVAADELDLLRGAYPKRKIDMVAEGDLSGRWDRDRCQQMLRNLVGNAIKHGEPDAPVVVALRGDDACARLEVVNDGPGIDASIRSQIFDPLRRGYSKGDDAYDPESLGLGLFIVREIAAAHGGEVDVQSAEGKTIFSVVLPKCDDHASLH